MARNGKHNLHFGRAVKPIVTKDVPKPFKTETMFKDLEQLSLRAAQLTKKGFEVRVNTKLLKIQYR